MVVEAILQKDYLSTGLCVRKNTNAGQVPVFSHKPLYTKEIPTSGAFSGETESS